MTIEITVQELKELTVTTPAQEAAKAAEKRYNEQVNRLAALQRRIAHLVNSTDADPAELARLTAEAKAIETILPNLQRAVMKAKATASAEARAQRDEAERPAILRQRLANVITERRLLNAEGQIAVWQGNIRQLQARDKALVDQIAAIETELQRLEA